MFALLVLLGLACAADFSGNEATFLPAHNQVRCGWGSAPVSYSAALEQLAVRWAASCPSAAAPFDPTAVDGENVFLLNPGGAPPYSGDVVTQLWSAEASTWACLPDACADAVSRCRNFRQIVWSATSQIGCAAVSNCTGAFPVVYVCRYRAAGNIVGQHPLANPSLQCPLNGRGACANTTITSSSSSTSTSSSSSSTTSSTSTSTTTPSSGQPPLYPATCSAQPKPVNVIRAPQTRVRFAFDGLLKGACGCSASNPPAPACPATCPVVSPNNVRFQPASLVL